MRLFPSLAVVAVLAGAISAGRSAPAPDQPWERHGIHLTDDEAAWLRANPTPRLGLDPQWPPFSFTNAKGGIEGIDVEFLREIEARLGIRFQMQHARIWEDTNTRIFDGSLDVVTGITPTAERSRVLLFTQPYISYPTAIITRLDGPFMADLSATRHLRLALPRHYVTSEKIRENHPQSLLIETDTVREALDLVARNKADFAVENLAVVSHLIRENGLTNLKIAGLGKSRFELHFGVRRDLPLLHSALDKALDSINPDQRARILADWINVESDYPSQVARHIRWAVGALAAVLLGLAGFALWNRRLKLELAERRRVEGELRQLNEEKSRFMNMAAHDINNPLTIIVMNCEIALARAGPQPAGDAVGYDNIKKHALRISHLIRSLLNSESIDQGLDRMHPGEIDLTSTVRRVVADYVETAGRKEITIHHDGLLESQMAWADQGAVMQVVENLISNAVKFSPRGSAVHVTLRDCDGTSRLEIRDSGPGISAADSLSLFGKYARLSALPTGNESSHGLGLYIVKQLMDEMSGRVWVEHPPGGGAMFVAEFPMMPPAAR